MTHFFILFYSLFIHFLTISREQDILLLVDKSLDAQVFFRSSTPTWVFPSCLIHQYNSYSDIQFCQSIPVDHVARAQAQGISCRCSNSISTLIRNVTQVTPSYDTHSLFSLHALIVLPLKCASPPQIAAVKSN